MKEILNQKLANPSQTPYSKGGDIFMAEPGKGEIQGNNMDSKDTETTRAKADKSKASEPTKSPHSSEEKERIAKVGEFLEDLSSDPKFQKQTEKLAQETPEQEEVRKKREESKGVKAYNQLGGTQGEDIFADIPEIPTNESELQTMAIEQLEEDLAPITDLAERQRIIDQRVERFRTLRGFIDQIRRGTSVGMGSLEDYFNQINTAINRGEIDAVSSEPYLTELARRAGEFGERLRQERTPEQVLEADRIAMLSGLDKTNALKNMIDTLDPDETISGTLFNLIAQDEEASEKFVNKVISKPFGTPDADYRLSFYAEINLQSFLTKVRNIPGQTERYQRYSAQHETALRLHEMNRATASQSGNIEGFLNISRTVTPEHLQTGVEIDGVEQARQILDMAFGRLYAGNKRLTQNLYGPEVLRWAERTFREKATAGVVKSSFKGVDGSPRNLEGWETERAFALARNFQTSFYRTAELVSWGNIPEASENWLQSMPAETIVRVLAHLKMLDRRFRVGVTRGGPEYTTLLYDDMKRGYDEKGGSLNKIGQLDVRTDLLPVGFSLAGGFDKGWRTVIDYLGSSLMQIDISNLVGNLPAGNTKDWLTKFIAEKNRGNEQLANFSEFFVNTAVFANIAHGQDIKIEGVQVPKELLPSDSSAAQKEMEELLLPLLGMTPKPDKVSEIAKPDYKFNMVDFDYNRNQDQINFSLGVLMNAGVSEKVKAILWNKSAEVLPLRLAYFLAEEGIRRIDGYEAVKGEGTHLFNDDFEGKLIALQLIRLREQKRIFQEEGRNRALILSNYCVEARLNAQEQGFLRLLQNFAMSKAADLAKISFPQVPFLDDVPFQNANYISLGAEVFPRRMGSDFRGYSEFGNAITQIVNNLGQPYEEIEKHITAAEEAVGGPEGIKTGQDAGYQLYKTYFRLAKQWSWTKIPGVKTISNFLNKPTSWLQAKFGPNGESWDARELSLRGRDAAGKGNIRFEKLPGEKESQMKTLLGDVNARPFNVFISEFINAFLAYLLYSSASFVGKTASEKT